MHTVQNMGGAVSATTSIDNRPSSVMSGKKEKEFGRSFGQTYFSPETRSQCNDTQTECLEDANKATTEFRREEATTNPVSGLDTSHPTDIPEQPEHALSVGFANDSAYAPLNAKAKLAADEQSLQVRHGQTARPESPVYSAQISGLQTLTAAGRTNRDLVRTADNQPALRRVSRTDPKGEAAIPERQETSSVGTLKIVNGSGTANKKDNPEAQEPGRRPEMTGRPFETNSESKAKGAIHVGATDYVSATKITPGKPEALAGHPSSMDATHLTGSDRRKAQPRAAPLSGASSSTVPRHQAELGKTTQRHMPLTPATSSINRQHKQVIAFSESKFQDQVSGLWQDSVMQVGLARTTDTLPARPEAARVIATQMADALIKAQNNKVEIALNPEELGRVRLALSTTDTGILVVIAAERAETLDLMRRHIDQLADEFRNLGYDDIGFEFTGGGTQKDFENDPAQTDSDHVQDPENRRDKPAPDPIEIARALLSRGLDLRL